MENGMIYGVKDNPGIVKTLIFALQQLLAILAATIAVPAIVGNGMSQSAALFGAGVGTIVYLLFTRFKSPVFVGSSFAFIGSMFAAFAGGVSASLGYLGLLIGAASACLVYVIIALIIKFVGSAWVNKLMPAVVIGPTVAIIGLSLAGNAVGDLIGNSAPTVNTYICIVCGLVTLFTTICASVFGKKMMKMIPFIIGIAAGYVVATIFTLIGIAADNDALKVVNFELFKNMQWVPDFTFIKAFSGGYEFGEVGNFGAYLAKILLAYVPVAFVVFAEHIADHKNLSTIIGQDLLDDPGLDNTLLGDGVGSLAGAFFGGCPNTTYGESVGCIAISRNASVITTIFTAAMCMVLAFIAPFTTLLATIPSCVMGGVCVTLYGFIAVSGLKMIQDVDLGDNRNLFVVSVILIAGVGGMIVTFGKVEITEVACALILGIITNVICSIGKKEEATQVVEDKAPEAKPEEEAKAVEATTAAEAKEEKAE